MEQGDISRKGKHLTREERVLIERMSRGGRPPLDIAEVLGRHVRCIEREIARGLVKHLDSELREKMVYSSDKGQDVHDLNATAKGPQLKLGNHRDLAEFIRIRILDHKESPAVVAFRMKGAQLGITVSTKTVYKYIDMNLIDGVCNESLWEKRQRSNRTTRHVRCLRKAPGRRQSIEKRPEQVENRQEFGHWEIDLVVGPVGSDPALLTLVERMTRELIVRKIPDKTQASIWRALNSIERECGTENFRKRFKSITADNGSEFLDVDALQKSIFSKSQRTCFFYAHPYASWERGSNENVNRIIRRFINKGRKIEDFTRSTISIVEDWINNYPRKIMNFKTAQERFNEELERIAA
jgi:IS30 family transposase